MEKGDGEEKELFAPGHCFDHDVSSEPNVEPPPFIELRTIENPDGNGQGRVTLEPPPAMSGAIIPNPPGTKVIIREVPLLPDTED